VVKKNNNPNQRKEQRRMIEEKDFIAYKVVQFYGISYLIDTQNQLAFVPSQIEYAKKNYKKLEDRGKIQEQIALKNGQAVAMKYLQSKKKKKQPGLFKRIFGLR